MLKNLTKSFELLKILLDIETKTKGITDNYIAICMQLEITEKLPPAEIIKNNKSRIFDNEKAVVNILGVSLTDKIKNYVA